MTVYQEPIHAGEFIVQEAEGYLSRDAATIGGGALLEAGTVLGRVITATATAAAKVGNTGNGAMGAVTVGDGAMVGAYILKITQAAANAGDFEVIGPDGEVVGIGAVGAAFDAGGLSFTLADGATDFVVGDAITITVAVSATKYVPLNLSGTDGSERAAAVLYAHADASAADVSGTVIARLAAVNGLMLTWPAGITDAQKAVAIAQLAEAHVIVRS